MSNASAAPSRPLTASRVRPHRWTALLAALVLFFSAGLVTSSGAAVPPTLAPGSLLVADGAGQVLVIAPDGSTSVLPIDGLVSPAGVSINGAGEVVVSDQSADRVVKLAADGTQTDIGTGLDKPLEVDIDDAGTVHIADQENARVLEVAPDGTQTVLGDGLYLEPHGLAVDASGSVFASEPESSNIWKFSSGGTQLLSPSLFKPMGLAVDGSGNLFIADEFNDRVVKLAPNGTQTTVVDTLLRPTAVAVDPAGNLYVVTFDGEVVKVEPDDTETVVASGLGNQLGSVAFVGDTVRAQTITFTVTEPPTTVAGDTFTVEATGGGSGNPVLFSGDPSSRTSARWRARGTSLRPARACARFVRLRRATSSTRRRRARWSPRSAVAEHAGRDQERAAHGRGGRPDRREGRPRHRCVPRFSVTDQDPIPGADPSTRVCRVDAAGNLYNLSPGECEVTVKVPGSNRYADDLQPLTGEHRQAG